MPNSMLIKWPRLLGIFAIALLSACGGGGSSEPPSALPTNIANPVPSGPTTQDYSDAALLLDLGTFGATYDDIEAVAYSGTEAWLDQQFRTPISYHVPVVRRYFDEYGLDSEVGPPHQFFRRFAFFENALTAPDQLRQLTAYALTQLFVVSDPAILSNNPLALPSYYDALLRHSFDNFRDLLGAVTLHPAMGFYLSHVNNAKTDNAANTFPDENFAREVMQLFTIGLYELNADGSHMKNADGQSIATYSNTDIREFAKIFTGLSYGTTGYSPDLFFGKRNAALDVPMVMFEAYHEPGEKTLLRGQVVPAGQSGMEDIDDALDNLFNHPNVGPFVGKQLIQRLVASNPSPDYVARVSGVFADNGMGERGDMEAVIRAILTDPEVAHAERVREPFRRYVAVNRALTARPSDGVTYGATGLLTQYLTGQFVLAAPSVFNFYSPFYRPAGGQGLVSPEMQITTEDTSIGITNLMAMVVYGESSIDTHRSLPDIKVDLSPFSALVDDSDAFIMRLDRLFFAGLMSANTKDILASALTQFASLSALERAQAILYLALISPDQAVTGGTL